MNLNFRFAKLEDLDAIFKIEEAVMPSPWTYASFKSAYDSENAFIKVAEVEGKIVGFSVVYVTAPEAELPDIVLSSNYQAQGIGKKLLDTTISEAKAQGVETIFLEVRASNTRAFNLYSGFGFEKIGIRKYFYSNPVEDAICMRLDIL